jgi:hypothetical protein
MKMAVNSARCGLEQPWYETTCIAAARSKSLECLKYAHENGCRWDEWTCYISSESGSLKCLKYAVENNCPIYKQECIEIARIKNNKDIFEYLLSLN